MIYNPPPAVAGPPGAFYTHANVLAADLTVAAGQNTHIIGDFTTPVGRTITVAATGTLLTL